MATGAITGKGQSFGMVVGFLGLAAMVGLGTLKLGLTAPILAGIALAGLALFMARPEVGLVIYLVIAFPNGMSLIGDVVGSPAVIAMGVTGLLGFPVFMNWFVRKRGVAIDHTFLMMIVFLGAVLTSAVLAKDAELALSWVMTYLLEGVLLYFLVINSVRRLETLKTAVWSLIFAATVLSSLAVYQEVTHSYDNSFGGLVPRNLERGAGHETDQVEGLTRSREKILIANRATGPAGGPNRFAQNLMVVLPLAMIFMWHERKKSVRIVAGVASLVILATIFLTYSRGGFLALIMLFALMAVLGYFRSRHILLGLVLGTIFVSVLAPGYVTRMDSMRGMERFKERGSESKMGDGAIRGRLTEMLAAFNVFLDYPILGVGPGHYSPYYSVEYMSDPSIAFRIIDGTRRAHSLYFEMAAETGIVGITIFLAMACYVMWRLWKLRIRWRQLRPDLSHLATAFFLGMLTYYANAFFLHLAYQRYYWLFLGLAAAAIRVIEEAGYEAEEREIEAAVEEFVELGGGGGDRGEVESPPVTLVGSGQ